MSNSAHKLSRVFRFRRDKPRWLSEAQSSCRESDGRALRLRWQKLNDDDIVLLLLVMRQLENLEELDLMSNSYGDGGIMLLFSHGIHLCPKLHTLLLDFSATDGAVQEICRLLCENPHPSLETLHGIDLRIGAGIMGVPERFLGMAPGRGYVTSNSVILSLLHSGKCNPVAGDSREPQHSLESEQPLQPLDQGTHLQEGSGDTGVQNALASFVSGGAKGQEVCTRLHSAVRMGLSTVVQNLLDSGADVEAANTNGSTPLHLAAEEGSEKMVKILLERRANIEAANVFGWTPLITAADVGCLEVVKQLLHFGADVTHLNKADQSALQIALNAQKAQVVELLTVHIRDSLVSFLEKGLSENDVQKLRRVLIVARDAGETIDLTADILQEARKLLSKLSGVPRFPNTKFAVADESNQKIYGSYVDVMLAMRQYHRRYAVLRPHSITTHRDAESVMDDKGRLTFLESISLNENTTVHEVASKNGAPMSADVRSIVVTTPLLRTGTPQTLRFRASDQNEVMMWAMHLAQTIYALRRNAPSDSAPALRSGRNDEVTVADVANSEQDKAAEDRRSRERQEEAREETLRLCMEMFDEADDDGDGQIDGRSVAKYLYRIFPSDEVVQYFMQRFEFQNETQINFEKFVDIMRAAHVVSEKLQSDRQEQRRQQTGKNNESAPLLVAAGQGQMEIVLALLERGANKEAADKNGWTPLISAAQNGHLQVLQALLDHGANKEAAQKDGATPLYMAAQNGHLE
eukprot:scaffold4886_cov162-Pinguiococcus_pyrenoidosus.AAC.1